MYCICCGKNIVKPGAFIKNKWKSKTAPYTEEDFLWSKDKDEIEYTTDGIIQIIHAGYGSNHDTSSFIIAICDDCITKNLEDGTILYFGNQLVPSIDSDRIEKSKQTYRRRKNLDDLDI